MTLGLNYLDDLSRVQISITDLPFSTGTARIERSTNGLYWQTVRGAAALPVVGGAAVVDDYEFTADVENHYRVVSASEAGMHLPGELGAYASTPDDPSLDITDDVDLAVDVRLETWSGVQQILVAKYDTAGQRAYALVLLADGRLRMLWSTDGASAATAESVVPSPDATGRLSVRSRLSVATGTVTFWTGTVFGSWTLLSVAAGAGSTTMFDSSASLTVGAWNEGQQNPAAGVVYRAEVRSGATLVAAPDFTGLATGTSEFTDVAGLTWTVHGDALVVGDPLFTGSITPSLDGKAWLKSIRHPFLNRPIHRALAGGGQSIGRASRGSVFEVQGRSVPVAVTDIRSSREFTLTVQVPDEAAARDMDLTLASGDVFFLQIPPELAPHMTGGYVRIGESTQHREADTIRWRFTIPCTVVAPPGPGVVGGTMTYGALLNLYGGYQNLLAANSTYADVLALMASPDDLVVL